MRSRVTSGGVGQKALVVYMYDPMQWKASTQLSVVGAVLLWEKPVNQRAGSLMHADMKWQRLLTHFTLDCEVRSQLISNGGRLKNVTSKFVKEVSTSGNVYPN